MATAVQRTGPQRPAAQPDEAEVARRVQQRLADARRWYGDTDLGADYRAAITAAGDLMGLSQGGAPEDDERALALAVLAADGGNLSAWTPLKRRACQLMVVRLKDPYRYVRRELYGVYDAISDICSNLGETISAEAAE